VAKIKKIMHDRIILVSDPDDILLQGVRILLFDLERYQQEIFSNCLLSFDNIETTIVYNYHLGNHLDWLIDKYHKSNIIFFNAGSSNELLVGFLAASRNSYYFGELRDLDKLNNSVIYDHEHMKETLTKLYKNYGKF
jgi:hypothetical protein